MSFFPVVVDDDVDVVFLGGKGAVIYLWGARGRVVLGVDNSGRDMQPKGPKRIQ